jgi:hypothetical protein
MALASVPGEYAALLSEHLSMAFKLSVVLFKEEHNG